MVNLLEEMEGHAFAARVGVVSDLKTFLEAVRSEGAVKQLAENLRHSDTEIESVLVRVNEHCHKTIDMRYANPSDIALAALLVAIRLADQGSARAAASWVLSASNLFWAARIAYQIQQEASAGRSSNTISAIFPISSDQYVVVRNSLDAQTSELVLKEMNWIDARNICNIVISDHAQSAHVPSLRIQQDAARARLVIDKKELQQRYG